MGRQTVGAALMAALLCNCTPPAPAAPQLAGVRPSRVTVGIAFQLRLSGTFVADVHPARLLRDAVFSVSLIRHEDVRDWHFGADFTGAEVVARIPDTLPVGLYTVTVTDTRGRSASRLGALEIVFACETGTACSDDLACTHSDVCTDGICNGVIYRCDDGDACTDDTCDGFGGCRFLPNGLSCDDTDPCTHTDRCGGTGCAGIAYGCDDDNPCTRDDCDGLGGCQFFFNTDPCDDADACTHTDACLLGACVGDSYGCDDGNPCTDQSCDGAGGCTAPTFNSDPCDDGDDCTHSDVCGSGVCGGTAYGCDDGNPCTDDACDGAGGCTISNNADPCMVTGCCMNGSCVPGCFGPEIPCNGVDDNGNGNIDEAPDEDMDGYDICDPTDLGDSDGELIDCRDLDPAINPGATEVCDGADNDCDTMIDPGCDDTDMDGCVNAIDPLPLIWSIDQDQDGYGGHCDCGQSNYLVYSFADGNTQKWNVFPTTITHQAAVAGPLNDLDATYVWTTTDGARETFLIDLSSIPDGTGYAQIGSRARVKRVGAGTVRNHNVHIVNGVEIFSPIVSTPMLFYFNSNHFVNIRGVKDASLTLEVGIDAEITGAGELRATRVSAVFIVDPDVHPGAAERPCDGIDQDCSGADVCP